MQPFFHHGRKQTALFDLQVMPRSIEHGKAGTWILLQYGPYILVARYMILPARQEQDWLVKGLHFLLIRHGKRIAFPYLLQKHRIGSM